MSAEAVVPDIRSRWHRFIEALLPWYDAKAEKAAAERSERIRKDAIAARISAEKVRADYKAMSRKLGR